MVSQVQANTQAARTIQDFGTHVIQNDVKTRTQVFDHPVQIGDSYYNHPNNVVQQFENTTPNYKVNN